MNNNSNDIQINLEPLKNKEVVKEFVGDFKFLSNFFPSTIFVEGKKYATVEHAFQALKTLVEEERTIVRNAKSPGLAKKLGKSVSMRNDWNNIKFDVMRSLIRLKFENPFLREMLLATGDSILEEGNLWKDKTWGIYLGEGENMLGKILMEERKHIQQEEL